MLSRAKNVQISACMRHANKKCATCNDSKKLTIINRSTLQTFAETGGSQSKLISASAAGRQRLGGFCCVRACQTRRRASYNHHHI